MFLHFVPVDGQWMGRVEYFSGIFGLERYVFIFYVSRKQACGQGLSLYLSIYKPIGALPLFILIVR
jgi:hypothetical protein